VNPANASTIRDAGRSPQFSLGRRAILPKLSARFATRIVRWVSGFVLTNPDMPEVSGCVLANPDMQDASGRVPANPDMQDASGVVLKSVEIYRSERQ
jgi:hypothetical protein